MMRNQHHGPPLLASKLQLVPLNPPLTQLVPLAFGQECLRVHGVAVLRTGSNTRFLCCDTFLLEPYPPMSEPNHGSFRIAIPVSKLAIVVSNVCEYENCRCRISAAERRRYRWTGLSLALIQSHSISFRLILQICKNIDTRMNVNQVGKRAKLRLPNQMTYQRSSCAEGAGTGSRWNPH